MGGKNRLLLVTIAVTAIFSLAGGDARAWRHYDSSDEVVLSTSEFVPRLRITMDDDNSPGLSGVELRVGGWRSTGVGGGLILGGYYRDRTESGIDYQAIPFLATASLHLLPTSRFSPYVGVGAGGMLVGLAEESVESWMEHVHWVWAGRGEAGLRIWVARNLGLDFAAVYDRTTQFMLRGQQDDIGGLTFRFGLALSPSGINIATASRERLRSEREAIFRANRAAATLQASMDRHYQLGLLEEHWQQVQGLEVAMSRPASSSYYPEERLVFSVNPGIYRVTTGGEVRSRLELPSCAARFRGAFLRNARHGVHYFVSVGDGQVELSLESVSPYQYHGARFMVLERLDVERWIHASPEGEHPYLPSDIRSMLLQ